MRIQQHSGRRAPVTIITPLSRRRRDGSAAQRVAIPESHDELAALAAASHDLRDPLQVISTYVDLLTGGFCGPVTSAQRSCLMRVRECTDHLAGVVGSILSIARAERDGRALEPSDVPVGELLSEVRALVEPFASAAGVSLIVDCEHAPTLVRGDRTALLRVLTNLAWNAVKFTRSGGRVSLSALIVADAVELRVVDTGPGIPAAELDAIFEPFVQVHPAGENARAGTGLGLTIARELTRLMGGELLVRSRMGVGSLFVARFPVAPHPGRQAAKLLGSKAA